MNGKQAIQHILHTLEGQPARPTLELLNTAGQHLCSMRQWGWLTGASAGIDFTATEDFAPLPAGLLGIIAVDRTDGFTSSFELTSLQDLLQMRLQNVSLSSVFYGALSWRAASPDPGPPEPVLELWPTPSTTEVGALTIFYTSGWTIVEDENDQLVIPAWIELLYKEVLRAVARGWEEEDEGSMTERLALIAQSHVFKHAAQIDSTFQPTVGVIRNGAVEGRYRHRFRRWWDATVAAP